MSYLITAKFMPRVKSVQKSISLQWIDYYSMNLIDAAKDIQEKSIALQHLNIGSIIVVAIEESNKIPQRDINSDPHITEKELGEVLLAWIASEKE